MKKNVLFHLKSSFRYQDLLNFCLDFLVIEKKGLIKTIRTISKFLTTQPGKQTTAIHIFLNISRSKGKQTIKFRQLIENNMRNIFLEKSYVKCG